ncbi:hypothetical protein ACOSQ2_030368 [Xanthoceras sorbifolium]
MADPYPRLSQGQQLTHGFTHHRNNDAATGKSMLCASLVGLTVGGPLLGMMGFSFISTLTLLLICSPLMLIFSPLLLCAALVLVGALAGFATAGAMAIAGVSTLAWSYREVITRLGLGFGGYLQQKGQENLQPLPPPHHLHHENRLIKIQ